MQLTTNTIEIVSNCKLLGVKKNIFEKEKAYNFQFIISSYTP
jgi:hypothetical protein